MKRWDDQAADHLAGLVQVLRQSGVIDLLQDEIRDMWRANMERYETELGDTARAFGFLASENISQRVQRRCERPDGVWSRRGVRVSTPDNSLLIQTCGVDIHVMKAQGVDSRRPDFDSGFDWLNDSATRLASADRNSTHYVPDYGQYSLFAGDRGVANPAGCTDLFLVWSGEIPTGLTAGWFGLPSTGTRSWMAVEQLWWDTPKDGPLSAQLRPGKVAPDGFEDRDVHSPRIGLKPLADQSKSQ